MGSNIHWRMKMMVFAALPFVGLLKACSTDPGTGQPSGDVQSRAVPQAQQPLQPAPSGQSVPTFPQKFDVQGPETQTFGFAVTQPGPITVDVQGQGAPLTVTLQSSGGQPTTQQATGNLRMNYSVTQRDVQRSPFWTVQIRLAQPMPPQQGGRASGSLNVQHPPVNQTALQQAVQAASAQRRQPTDQEKADMAARSKAQLDAAFNDHKARFEQQRQQRHAALLAAAQPLVAQMQAQTGGAVRPRGVEETSSSEPAAAPGEDVSNRAVRSRGVEENSSTETAAAPGEDVASRGMLSGSGTLMLSPAMVMPNPAITSACVPVPVQPGQPPQCLQQGQPGDPVMITGSNFGTGGGEIHFVIATGKDVTVVAPSGATWNNTQIFTSVPDASGVPAFSGTVYVKRASDKVSSNLMIFRFNPLTELRQIVCPQNQDMVLAQLTYTTVYSCGVYRTNSNWFWTPQGNDQFFVNTRLKNGWMVVQQPSVVMSEALYTAGGAYLADSRVGTDSPYVNTRFWVNAGISNALFYRISVLIQGPKGVADGIVCQQSSPQAPCPPS